MYTVSFDVASHTDRSLKELPKARIIRHGTACIIFSDFWNAAILLVTVFRMMPTIFLLYN